MSLATAYAQPELAYRPVDEHPELQPNAWMARAVAAYMQRYDEANLRTTIARQVRLLTDKMPADEQIWVDVASRAASVAVDGMLFRLEQGQLLLMRPCAHCGVGQLASVSLRSEADLGHALAVWQPLHADCRPEDPAE
jgi:hypothetical protein